MGADIVVSHLRIFDCLAIAKELNHVGKFDDQSMSGSSSATRRVSRPTASSTLRHSASASPMTQRRARLGLGQGGG